ncbi:hypothetical protein [Myroides sp. WP-1]|uniref:hypothetical protein n=1 Tax=Myroides sp. WP-1 TaxID=2759944 RepID=UPI0015F798A9|nr:hypothetical protein [Myroides sp. WP-1]MBB1139775.1 hypothetical protein [Myroides sp. WP-1]
MRKVISLFYPYYLLSFTVTTLLTWTTVVWWFIPSLLGTFLALIYFGTFRQYELYFFKNKGWQPHNLVFTLLGSNLILAFLISIVKIS